MRTPLILALLLTACGDEPPPIKTRGGAAAPAGEGAGGPAAPRPAAGKDAPQPLVTKAKVPADYRRDFVPDDFVADATGEANRDPFFSYLVMPAPPAGTVANPAVPIKDECENKMVAGKAGFRDLKLVGIILRGTRNFAMFTDSNRTGHTVFLGDCLAKEKARVVEITTSCVKLQVASEAPPGAAAPPPREELVCLHPDDLSVQ